MALIRSKLNTPKGYKELTWCVNAFGKAVPYESIKNNGKFDFTMENVFVTKFRDNENAIRYRVTDLNFAKPPIPGPINIEYSDSEEEIEEEITFGEVRMTGENGETMDEVHNAGVKIFQQTEEGVREIAPGFPTTNSYWRRKPSSDQIEDELSQYCEFDGEQCKNCEKTKTQFEDHLKRNNPGMSLSDCWKEHFEEITELKELLRKAEIREYRNDLKRKMSSWSNPSNVSKEDLESIRRINDKHHGGIVHNLGLNRECSAVDRPFFPVLNNVKICEFIGENCKFCKKWFPLKSDVTIHKVLISRGDGQTDFYLGVIHNSTSRLLSYSYRSAPEEFAEILLSETVVMSSEKLC
jgi:hypothetical protein